MFSVRSHNPSKAVWMLLLATSFWSTTFLLMKVLARCQEKLVPGASSWFYSSLSLLVRFGLGAAILLLWRRGRVGRFTRSEVWQGAGLGLFGGLGLVLQMDGVQYAAASTTAFLTQCYCVIIPIWVAVRRKKCPSITVILSCLMVLTGVAVLSNVNWSELRLGRGEAETIGASLLFTGQILWLERPVFAGSRTGSVTLVMFFVLTLSVLPVVLLTTRRPSDVLMAFSSAPTVAIVVYLTIACTVVSFVLMNRWQSHISSTHASLIYCTEPLFTSAFALFLPAMLSSALQINYPNEVLTTRLHIGGGLVTGANILMFWHATRTQVRPVPKPEQVYQKARGA